MFRLTSTLFALAVTFASIAQTAREEIAATPEKAGGVYYAYPVTESLNTPAPKGYEPFYVSHYGRHGSRFLISDDDYRRPLRALERANEAGTLTPLGVATLEKMRKVWEEANGRGGELSPLGYRQHRGIAQRMYANFPQAFSGQPELTARSTQVMRCAHSMMAFTEALKEINPKLEIPKESSARHMSYLCYSTPESQQWNRDGWDWREEYNKFDAALVQPDRLMSSLFSDSLYVVRHVNPHDLMWDLYWLAMDMQNMETNEEFISLFTNDELYDLWQVSNFSFYIHNSSYPLNKGMMTDNAKHLLANILETADDYVGRGQNGATLRFGHDGNITPLVALMQLDGFYGYETDPYKASEAWRGYYVSPMAANLQLILYRNPKDPSKPLLAKVMMNEREATLPIETSSFPYYDWDTLRGFFQHILDTPSRDFMK